ncbi:MAG: transglycosylase domain-containing protein [Solirubrobacterales bacterium]|nr:transglycosylase domain-containing protein [Solirubrobacterales bacterium]
MSVRRDRRRRRRSSHGGASKILLLAFGVMLVSAVLVGLSAVGYVVSIATGAPPLEDLEPADPGANSVVYAADGKTRLGVIESEIARRPVTSAQIPESLKDATVAIEDRRFYQHRGVDFEGVVRAAVKNLRSGETVQGGSTLTMQLVRTLYISNERTFKRKIREAKLAEELENAHPGRTGKAWILTKYLNSVPYGTVGGQEALGVEAASRIYFDKRASELDLHESAMLAGLPQAPSLYSPFQYPRRAKLRRNDVLDRMAEQGFIAVRTAQRAKRRGLELNASRYYTQRRESFFFDYVKQELINRYGVATVRRGGLRVYTTVDLRLQRAARASIAERLTFPDPPSGAVVSISPRTGYIRAMASSARYGERKFNLAAQGKRQPGSTFKTMALMAAVARGVDPDSTSYESRRLKFTDPRWGPIDVSTYADSYAGRISLARATLSSDNSVFTQLALDVGPDKIKETAHQMGIRSKLNGYPGEALGGLERGVSPLEMANAYATIASGGWRNRPKAITRVVRSDGHVDDLRRPRRHKAFRNGVTHEVTALLEQNIQRGTGRAAQIRCPAAGKTGTTDEHKDAWFVGYTPRLATAVWVGYPDRGVEMTNLYRGGPVAGGTFPAEIWGDYMGTATRGACADFPQSPTEPVALGRYDAKYARQGAPGAPGGDDRDGTFSRTPGPAREAVPTPDAGAGGPTSADGEEPSNGGGRTGGGGSDGGRGGGGDADPGATTGGSDSTSGGFDPGAYESPSAGADGE